MLTRIGLALLLALAGAFACKAGAGDRCICADDCKNGLVCLAGGRVLQDGDCSPAIGEDAEPGECVDAAAAGEGEDEIPEPDVYMDLGSKRDFDPVPPMPPTTGDTDTGTGTATTSGTDATSDTGSTSGTDTTSSTGSGSSDSSGSSGSSDSGSSTGSGSSSDSGSSTTTL